jgi:hypothetical protein
MKSGDLVYFKCIGAGKRDNPPYSQDGQERLGLLINNIEKHVLSPFHMVFIFYRGDVFRALLHNCRPLIEEKDVKEMLTINKTNKQEVPK